MRYLFLLISLGNSFFLAAQIDDASPKITPVPPSSYQFIKFGEMPVSEYTGVPNISIPIYEIKDGDISFPLTLSYHAGGIKVAEEATWVGLGWNLDVGSITQVVNDRDDLASFRKTLPDYYAYGGEYRHEFPFDASNPDFTPSPMAVSNGITKEAPVHTFIVYTAGHAAINGSYVQDLALFNAQGGDQDIVDSEPDVFRANFNGHYLEFIMDFSTGTFKVLNRHNYVVQKVTDASGKPTWRIVTPEGMEYKFEQVDYVEHDLSFSVTGLASGSQSDNNDLVSKIWHLTKITSPKNRVLSFTWEVTAPVKDIPGYSNKNIYSNYMGITGSWQDCGGPTQLRFVNFSGTGSDGTYPVGTLTKLGYSSSSTKPSARSYLSSVVFSQGTVSFKKSQRLDRTNDMRLDSIMVNTPKKLIKKFVFDYGYFIATEGGSSIDQTAASNSLITAQYSSFNQTDYTYRLKLNSVQEVGVPPHVFHYDATPLPRKTSYATDYWGYYNGKITNTSFVPNPTHLNIALPDNGNDRRPNLNFTRACTLTEIIYPTGGKTKFDFSLNTFTFDFLGLYTPPINEGAGLRINTITNATDEGTASITRYSYSGGRAMNTLFLNTSFSLMTYYHWSDGISSVNQSENFQVQFLTGNNSYNSSLLGSGNFIGYDAVTKETLDANGNANGKIVSCFYNSPDISAYDGPLDLPLPARKDPRYPDNGLLKSEEIYDSAGKLLRKKTNQYSFQISTPYYGVKLSGSGYYLFEGYILGNCANTMYTQTLAGYYPLYSGESLLDWSEEQVLDGTNIETTHTDYVYYPDNTVALAAMKNSKGETINTNYDYPNYCSMCPSVSGLRTKNILNRPIRKYILNGAKNITDRIETYADFNGLPLVSVINEQIGANPREDRIIFDKYDSWGNVIEYHKPSDISHSFIWALQGTVVQAEVNNAKVDQIAYSGFEDPLDFGGWSYTSNSTINQSQTGKYGFIGSSISKNGGISVGDYEVSFWSKRLNGTDGSISGSVTTSINSDLWKLYTFKLSSISSFSLNLSNVVIDDLRLYPVGAQMSTYEHDPLIGITSTSDQNNMPTYYEYDSQGRLVAIRDSSNKILKTYYYHFKSN